MEYMTSIENGVDDLKPSLFELLSEQQLASLIPPSLRYLLAITTHRHPRYLLQVLNSFDELYAILMLLVERHFLTSHGGGFTENFYGLKRERVLRIRGGEIPRAQLGAAGIVRETLKLRREDIWKNLAVMVGLPYLKRKLDESYEIHAPQATLLGPSYNRDALPAGASIKQRIMYYYKWFLRKIYPSVNAAYYFSLLAFNLAYLFDSSKYHSPFLWLVGTRMRRMGEADYRAIALASQSATQRAAPGARPGQSNSILNPRTFGATVYPRLLSSLRVVLPASIFVLKFLEWWHASDFARQLSRKATEGLELPPPIVSGLSLLSDHSKQEAGAKNKDTSSSKEAAKGPKHKPPIDAKTFLPILTVPATTHLTSNLCPICLNPIETATAAQTGYVYCYTCIYRWVDGSHDRQLAFMEGGGGEEAWAEEEGSRVGRWESGKGRCAVTGRRVLGGMDGLRRIMV
ncbi:MAG: ubiquitin-protein ligase peroxin 12 [Candelina submexicana]|nr:MAG: ubiquitin-protein ligase peroxin 12 [Candelina submexicana]